MFSRLNITAKGLILVAVPVIIEICFASYLTFMLTDTFTKLVRMQHSIDAMESLSVSRDELVSRLCEVMNFYEPDVNKRLEALDHIDIGITPVILAKGEQFPELIEFRDSLETSYGHMKAIVEKIRTYIKDPKNQHSTKSPISDSELLPAFLEANSIGSSAFAMEKQLSSLQPHELQRFKTEFFCWLIAGLLTSCGFSFWISHAFTRDMVLRLQKIAENTRLISYGQPLKPVQEGTDEIAELDAAVWTAGQELDESRKRELAVLDNATDVLCSLDKTLRFRDVGKAATRNWGYELDELPGRSILSLLTDASIETSRFSFEQIANENKEIQIENDVRCKDGTIKTFLWTVNWRTSDNLFYCVAHDVTQIRAVERLKRQFLTMVSHDLRTPLNSVSLGLAMLAENRLGILPDAVQAQLAKSRRSMENLSHLIHDLLELEKFGSGKMTLNCEVASAAEICGYAKDQLEELARRSGIKIAGPENDAAVLADVKRTTQVIVNLLSNAIKFSAIDSTILLDIKEIDRYVEIGVKDNGPGIPETQKSLIFERFYQSVKAAENSVKSTGLGLAIVQAIVEQHGGKCGVESELGKGSRFWVQVPRLEDEDEEAP